MQEGPLEVLGEGGLPGHAARLLDPDRRRHDRLVRAALGPEGDARRRADEDRLPAGVDAERPRLVRAHDERVVDRAHGQQRAPVAAPGRPQLAEQADEVDLRDAQLDVAPVVGLAPAHERVGVVGEPVDALADAPDAAAVDPAAEVRRRGDVGRDGDHVRGHLRRLVVEVDEQPPERLLRGPRPRVRAPELDGHRRRLVARDGLALEPRGRRGAQPPLGRVVLEGPPRVVGVGAQLPGEVDELLVVEQRRVVGRVALGGQRPALDRVGEDDRRAVAHGVGGAVGGQQPLEVVAAEVAEGGQQLARPEVRDQPRDAADRRRAGARATARRRRAAGAGTPRCPSRRCARAARRRRRGRRAPAGAART